MLLIEKLWQSFWMVASIALVFVFLLLVNVPQSLGSQWHLALVIIFGVTVLATLVYQFKKFRFPSRKEVERKIEISNNVKHRPISTTKDKPIGATSDVWKKHIKRAKNILKKLRIYKPYINVTKQDKFAFRHIALLLAITGLIIAGYDWDIRLKEGFTPEITISSTQASLDVWVDPPKYIDTPAVFLNSASQGLVNKHTTATKGSVLKIRASGYLLAPTVTFVNKKYELKKETPKTFTADIPLNESGVLNVSNLIGKKYNWAIKVVKDAPPTISLNTVKSTSIASTKITYIANDDYKISELRGIITAHSDNAALLGNDTYYFSIPTNISDDEQKYLVDLTSHLWAGKKVNLSIKAIDSFDQESFSSTISFTLPERRFNNPTSRKIALDRKKIIWSSNDKTYMEVAKSVTQIASFPHLHKGSAVDFLALRAITRRLMYGIKSTEEKTDVIDLLWDIAINLEDGGLLTAQSDLYRALQDMREALADKNIRNDELQRILQEVQIQMQKYIMAMAMEMNSLIKQGKVMPSVSSSLANKLSKKLNLSNIMDQIRNLQDANSLEDLRKMAENLQNSLENFSVEKMNESQKKQMEIMKALENIEKIITDQEKLLSTTNKTSDKEKIKKLAVKQSFIQDDLTGAIGKTLQAMGKTPENFLTAYKNMSQSTDALKQTFAHTSIIHQQKALADLKKGLDKSLDALAEALKKSMMSFNFMPQGGKYGDEHDPLGRKMNTDGTKIPDKIQRRRIQIILDELRKRSNDYSLSPKEREYIDRLIY